MHQHVVQDVETIEQHVFDLVANAVPLGHRQLGVDFHVDIREKLDSRLAHPEFLDPFDAGHAQSRLANPLDDVAGAWGSINSLAELLKSMMPVQTTAATTNSAATES